VKLSPSEKFRVLDVGSGEIGFYSYWLDSCSRRVCTSGTQSKFKYKKNLTFVDQFLEDPKGAQNLSEEIVSRFELDQPTSVALLRKAAFVEDGPTIVKEVSENILPGAVNVNLKDQGSLEGSIDSTRFSSPPLSARNPRHKKKKLFVCLTGANRQMLSQDVTGRLQLQEFLSKTHEFLDPYNVECIAFSPEDVDEAMYELWATEWVVQHGDMDVSHMKLGRAYRTLQGGDEDADTNWKEILHDFCDLNAETELECAYREAAEEAGVQETETSVGVQDMPISVPCSHFYDAFNNSPALLRALLRARLFSGTLSAGSGSSQVTLRCSTSLDTSQVHSLPVGNRTPVVSMKLALTADAPSLLSTRLPHTRVLAQELLCIPPASRPSGRTGRHASFTETKAAWSEDGPVCPERLEQWRELVTTCADESHFPTEQRGLFVGISAVYYAAKLAGCEDKVLKRDEFLERLELQRNALMKEGGHDRRGLSNLVLVAALVQFVLHRTSLIVCKRNWHVGEGMQDNQMDFVATWSLGMYLKHSGVMGVPLRVQSA